MPDPFFEGADDYETGLPTLRTARLQLRPLTPADDPQIVDVFSDERSLETWFRPPLASVDQARAYRDTLQEGFGRRSLFIWGVFPTEEADGTLAGIGILTRWSPVHRRIDLGYYFASHYWGRGYATETARGLVDFSFGSLGCHRVEAEVVPGNDASVRVLERAGFVREALLKERLWGDDAPQDSMLFRLLRTESQTAAAS